MTRLEVPRPTRSDNSPLRVQFVLTSMPVGGAETLLVNLLRAMPRGRIDGELICLKGPGPLGESLASEFRVHSNLIRHKWDIRVLSRLVRIFRERQTDAIVTVGCGDKMFWGRLAAYLAGVPVIASALHSTGWPDGVGVCNRWLTPITDAFIAVAPSHGEFLHSFERFPQHKVMVIPNGIDVSRFCPDRQQRLPVRRELGLPENAMLAIMVAALRPEKNHARLLRIAAEVISRRPQTHFLVVGSGELLDSLSHQAAALHIADHVHFLGNRSDTERLLAASDLFLLTSDNEAYPVSILEAMACGLPVVASDVGSIHELVASQETGYRVATKDEAAFTKRVEELIDSPVLRETFGNAARTKVVQCGSLEVMVQGYVNLLEGIFTRKRRSRPHGSWWLGTLGNRRPTG